MYSKGIISTAFITNVTTVGELKFEVVTNNRTFIFRAESEGMSVHPAIYVLTLVQTVISHVSKYAVNSVHIYIFVGADFTTFMSDLTCLCALIAAERNEWVTVLQDCTSGRQRHTVMNPGSPLAPDYQGYLELKGLRSKLYTVVASDKVFLYKNIDVRTLGAAVCTDLYLR